MSEDDDLTVFKWIWLIIDLMSKYGRKYFGLFLKE